MPRTSDWRKTPAQSSHLQAGWPWAAEFFRPRGAPGARLRRGCLTIVLFACSQAQAGDARAFHIPEQRADLALIAFAEQADRTLLFSFDETSRRTTNRLSGNYGVLEALDLLLAGTGLSISMGIQGQLTVAEAAGSNPETAMQGPTSILGRIGVLLTGALVGSNATAQPSDTAAAADDDLIEEVVVTAQRRSENLQDVPISITALTGDDIDTYRFRDPGDLAAQTPNMSVQTVQGAGTPVFSLRGVSMHDWSFNQAGPVAPYIDEVYKGNPSLLAVPFFDLERVEVMRGPQGTLYGKNTTGGAINFITRKPVMENEGYLTAGAGDYSLYEVEGAFNAALSDTLAVRLAGTYAQRDGWLRVVTPGVDDANSVDEYGVRLGVLWRPEDDVEVLLRASSAESDPTNFGVKMAIEAQPAWFGIYGLYNAFGGTPLSDPTQAGLGSFENHSDQDLRRLVATDSVSLTASWAVNDNFAVKSITSFDQGEALNPEDGDGALNRAAGSAYHVDVEQFAQDLQISSTFAGPFNFVAGLYYSREELQNSNEAFFFLDVDFNLDGMIDPNDCLDPMAVAFGFPPSDAGAATEALFNSLGFSLAGFATLGCTATNSFDQEKTSIAAYFDGNYDLSDSLVLRFGVRVTDDEAEQNNFNAHLAGAGSTPLIGTINGGSPDPLATVPGQAFSDTEITGRIGLDYTMDNGTLIYASFNQGYRGGAFMAQALFDPGELSAADPEYLDSYEVGFKTTLADGRVRLNGAAFYYSYENQQFISFDTATFLQTLINIDESDITGLEIELLAQVTPALLLQLGVGVLDAEVKEGLLGGADLSGETLAGSPDLNLNAAVDWNLFSNQSGTLTLHVSGTYQDETIFVFDAGQADSYSVVNARLSFSAVDDRWVVSLWGKNLAEEEYFRFWADARDAIGYVYSHVGPPRTYGLELTYRF